MSDKQLSDEKELSLVFKLITHHLLLITKALDTE